MGSVHAKSVAQEDIEDSSNRILGLNAQVKKVNVDGLGRTKDDIVINSIKDLFKASDFKSTVMKIHEARTNLEDLGCFKNISVLIDTYNDENVDHGIEVTFTVKELNYVGARVSTDIGNNEGTFTTGGKLRNVFGRGERLEALCSYGSKKSSSFFATFTKPFHNQAHTDVATEVYKHFTEVPWSGYKEADIGALISMGFSSMENVNHRFALDGTWRNLSCLSRSSAFAVREQSGHTLKTSLRHDMIIDNRDDEIFPTDGVSIRLKNELAGMAGDIGFVKNEVDIQVNVPLFKSLVLQGGFQAGHMTPLNKTKTHCINDRFVLGGPSSIRGFEMAGIGPHSEGCALGAEMFWAAALHIYAPLPLLESGGAISDKFRLHGFVNTGNIGDFSLTRDYRRTLDALVRDMRLTYGAGMAMNLGGIARVELNYCLPLLLQRGDRPSQGLQFGVSGNFL